MNFRKPLLGLAFAALLLPLSVSALVMRPNGPEPVIVQIKESFRISDDLENRLNEFASARNQNHLSVVKWWAGHKLLVMLSFPTNFTERQATAVIAKLQQLAVVEKVVAISAFNLHFRSGDFVREYGPNDTIPDVARRGFDADRIGKPAPTAPNALQLLAIPHVPNRLIVGWKEEYIWKADSTGFSQTIANLHQQTGCRIVHEFRYSPTKLHQVLEFDDPTSLASKLQKYVDSGFVTYAQPDYIYQATARPNDPWYLNSPGPQWTLPLIGAEPAWGITTGDPSVIVAVADSGANVNHPEFTSNLWSGQNSGEIHNFISNSTNVDDDSTVHHGSNVASIIGAQGNNGAYMTGVAWRTSLMILKIFDSQLNSSSSLMVQAINYAWENGASVINISGRVWANPDCSQDGGTHWFCDPGEYDQFEDDAIRNARNHNMVIVGSAGNDTTFRNYWPDGTFQADSDKDMNKKFPASYPADNIISVLATTIDDSFAPYSCFGRYRVDLGAPGGSDSAMVLGLSQDPGSYTLLEGTSMAAPHVSGALALIKSLYPWENYAGLRDRVLMGADHLGTLFGKCRTNGRLDLYNALQKRSMLRNLSTRARVENGDGVLIGGFTIGGSASGGALRVLIRGMGPSLPGVNAPLLQNPQIDIYGPNNYHETNYDWAGDPSAGEVQSIGFAPPDGRECAMIRSLMPGAYTVVVSSQDGQPGVGQFQIYELDGNANEQSRLLNLSSRCLIGTGDERAIAGTIIGDANTIPDRRVLMRGIGPSLTNFGVSGALGDPQLETRDAGDNLLASNDQWRTIDDDSGDGDALEEKLTKSGWAPSQPSESLLWPTFRPGSYTIILSGANGSTGIGLIELDEY